MDQKLFGVARFGARESNRATVKKFFHADSETTEHHARFVRLPASRPFPFLAPPAPVQSGLVSRSYPARQLTRLAEHRP